MSIVTVLVTCGGIASGVGWPSYCRFIIARAARRAGGLWPAVRRWRDHARDRLCADVEVLAADQQACGSTSVTPHVTRRSMAIVRHRGPYRRGPTNHKPTAFATPAGNVGTIVLLSFPISGQARPPLQSLRGRLTLSRQLVRQMP